MELAILLKLFVAIVLPSAVYANKTAENQRKYEFTFKKEDFFKLKKVSDFQVFQHSNVVTEDIYFDTLDQKLRKSGLTLRIRRAKKNEEFSYAIQLKTEKKVTDIPRQELDYGQLDSQEFDRIKIQSVVDLLLQKKESQKQIEILQKWIVSKTDSTLLPFVFLKKQGIKLSSIHATMQGYSERTRFFVYSDIDHKIDGLDYSKTKNKKDLPDFFKKDPKLIWLMEGSFDKSSFYRIGSNALVGTVNELELENKIKPAKYGNKILDLFENELAKMGNGEFKLIPKYKSKYLQMLELTE